jgi:hypothetical protein
MQPSISDRQSSQKRDRNQHFTNSYVLIKFHRSEVSSSLPTRDEEDRDDTFPERVGED